MLPELVDLHVDDDEVRDSIYTHCSNGRHPIPLAMYRFVRLTSCQQFTENL